MISNDESIKRRLNYLRERVHRLEELRECTLDEYLADIGLRDQVERNYQLAVECCTDIASHFLATRCLPRPDRRRDIFQILVRTRLMPRDFAEVMSKMVSVRNRLVHVYMIIDPVEMHRRLQEDIAHFEAFEAIALAWIEKREAQQGDNL